MTEVPPASVVSWQRARLAELFKPIRRRPVGAVQSGNLSGPAALGELAFSRFALLRGGHGRVIAETANSPDNVALLDSRAWHLALAFNSARALDARLAEEVGLPLDVCAQVLGLLLEAQVLVSAGRARAESTFPLAAWEFHDMLFHARTRGRSPRPTGGTFRFLDDHPPPPALPPRRWSKSIALDVPDLDEVASRDPSLTDAQLRRCSTRAFGELPPTREQLGEFLYRTGRIEEIWDSPIPGPPPNVLSLTAKPYPSGGSLYELELYVLVGSCSGLPDGLYHYAAERNQLEEIVRGRDETEALRHGVATGMGVAVESLQIVIIVTSRHPRLAWKYEGLAYELCLKHVGVLMQTMYLTASAMGLAACAVGSGDSDAFAQVSGLPYAEETAVGEFALGSLPTGAGL